MCIWIQSPQAFSFWQPMRSPACGIFLSVGQRKAYENCTQALLGMPTTHSACTVGKRSLSLRSFVPQRAQQSHRWAHSDKSCRTRCQTCSLSALAMLWSSSSENSLLCFPIPLRIFGLDSENTQPSNHLPLSKLQSSDPNISQAHQSVHLPAQWLPSLSLAQTLGSLPPCCCSCQCPGGSQILSVRWLS